MSLTLSDHFRFSSPMGSPLLIGALTVSSVAIAALTSIVLSKPQKKITPSPRSQVFNELSKKEQDELAYPPDAFPGARDVQSSYGYVRVYEWGPETGKKVVLIHGITTPCIALGDVAETLVERGCRVILFDLFGRGYSDTPDLPHDTRLYSTQILLAITSSPLSWTPDGFSLVGYSLGGGIAAAFAVDFPDLVKDIVLLAPAGLIRSHHFGWSSRLVFLPIVPDFVAQAIVGRRLRGTAAQKSKDAASSADGSKGIETGNVVNAEIKGNRDSSFESAGLSKARPNVTIADAVQWQVEKHEGFIKSFTSSVRYAPIERQEETWKSLRKRDGKILILAGKKDVVIVHDELKEDVSALLDEERFIWKEMDGGHEFPIAQGDEVGRIVAEAWGL